MRHILPLVLATESIYSRENSSVWEVHGAKQTAHQVWAYTEGSYWYLVDTEVAAEAVVAQVMMTF